MPRKDPVAEVEVWEHAIGGKVDGDCAERVQHDEDDGHDAGMAVADVGEDPVGVVEVALLEVSSGDFFAVDYGWRWTLR